ncbi:hypothetical protein Tco_0079329 [Tanacetum coccineum]
MTMAVSEHFSLFTKPSFESEIRFLVERRPDFSRSQTKRDGKESANENSFEVHPSFNSSFVECVQNMFLLSNSKEFMNVFMRIGFGSTIKLVSFDEGQMVTFAVYRNGGAEPGSWSTTTALPSWSISLVCCVVVSSDRMELSAIVGRSSSGFRVRSGSSKGSTSSELEARVSIQERNCGKCGAQNSKCDVLVELMLIFDQALITSDLRRSAAHNCNTQPNPKGSSSKPYQPPQAQNEHVNAVFTQSGKSYDPPTNPNGQQNDSETLINFDSEEEEEESTPQPKS